MECVVNGVKEPAEREPVKFDCYWYNCWKDVCGCLSCLQCEETGRCSFFETTEEYKKRNINFNGRKV